MVTVLALVGVAAVLFIAAVLATSDQPMLADAPPDRADLPLPEGPVRPEDVAAVRFSLAPRGYRMAEVDEVLARLGDELADRDRRLELLEAAVVGQATTPGAGAPPLPIEAAVVGQAATPGADAPPVPSVEPTSVTVDTTAAPAVARTSEPRPTEATSPQSISDGDELEADPLRR